MRYKPPASFTFYFTALILVYTVYDYLGHYARAESVFNEYPFDWFLFSLASVASLLILVLGIKCLLEKLFMTQNLLFELTAIGSWLVTHLYLLGPVYNELFWPHSSLIFQFQFSGFVILLLIYFTTRIILNLLMKKPVLKGY